MSGPWPGWPDWQGETVAIIASGPSAKSVPYARLRGRARVLAIKESIDLCPWADVVYGCDAPWWRSRHGLVDFKGLRVSYDRRLTARFGDTIKFVDIDMLTDRILTETPGRIGCGGNSGYQAVNLAVQWGARRILLAGFDMHDRGGVHWYGRAHGSGRSNPGEWNFRRWRAAFEASAGDLIALGVDVVNLSPASELRCFPKRSLDAALAAWGLLENADCTA